MCFPALLAAPVVAGAVGSAGAGAAAATAATVAAGTISGGAIAAGGGLAAASAAAAAGTAGAVAGSAAAASAGILGTGLSATQLLGLGSTLFSAGSTVAAGKASSDAGKANAKIAERNALVSSTAASRQEQDLNKRRRMIASSQQATGAKQGRAPTGSFLDVQQLSNENTELDILSTVYGGALGVQSGNFAAKTARAGGKGAKLTGIFGGGATLLTGGARAFG